MGDETKTETKATAGRVARDLLEGQLAELGLSGTQKTGYKVYDLVHGRQLRLWMNRQASSCGRVELLGYTLAGAPGFHGIPEAERDGRAECGVDFGGDAADVLERVRSAVQAAVEMPASEKPKRRAPGVVEHQELPAEKRDDVAGVRAISDPAKRAARLALIAKVAAAKGTTVSSSLEDLFLSPPTADTQDLGSVDAE